MIQNNQLSHFPEKKMLWSPILAKLRWGKSFVPSSQFLAVILVLVGAQNVTDTTRGVTGNNDNTDVGDLFSSDISITNIVLISIVSLIIVGLFAYLLYGSHQSRVRMRELHEAQRQDALRRLDAQSMPVLIEIATPVTLASPAMGSHDIIR